MKKIIPTLLFAIIFYACAIQPKNFTYHYKNEYTGLDKLIDINGYYVSQHGCDSTFYSMYMFYPNGLFTIATTSKILPELIDCFTHGGTSPICQYPLWGTYQLEGDLIKTQVIRKEGNGCTIFRSYRILADKSIVNISDYVEPQYTNLGYMSNYPSFENNPCAKAAEFYPLPAKRKPQDGSLLKK